MSVKRKRELSWHRRAQIIYFHLHPDLANKRIETTSKVFAINSNTLQSWIGNKKVIPKWYPLVDKFRIAEILDSIPDEFAENYRNRTISGTINLRQYYFEGCDRPVNENQSSKRIAGSGNRPLGRGRCYLHQEQMIASLTRRRWERGDPVTKSELRQYIMHATNVDSDFYRNCCDASLKSFPSYLNKFISRVLEREALTTRKRLVVDKVPPDWRQIVEKQALEIRERMKKKEVAVLIAADEVFFHFNGDSLLGLLPNAMEDELHMESKIENDGYVVQGCTVMLAIELVSGSVLQPLIVFGGGERFSSTEEYAWMRSAQNGTSKVCRSQSMGLDATISTTWLQYIRNQYPGQNIGIVWDNTISHCNPTIDEWLVQDNDSFNNVNMTVSYLKDALSCISNPVHQTMKSVFKQSLLRKFRKLDTVYSHAKDDPFSGAGILKHCINRVKLVEFIESVCMELSISSKTTLSIPKAFRSCGIDPWQEEVNSFEASLDAISVNQIYDRLISGQQYLQLE